MSTTTLSCMPLTASHTSSVRPRILVASGLILLRIKRGDGGGGYSTLTHNTHTHPHTLPHSLAKKKKAADMVEFLLKSGARVNETDYQVANCRP
jgi:hypothetical protein